MMLLILILLVLGLLVLSLLLRLWRKVRLLWRLKRLVVVKLLRLVSSHVFLRIGRLLGLSSLKVVLSS
jgi:hypothetical protein